MYAYFFTLINLFSSLIIAGYSYTRPGGRNSLEIRVKQHTIFKSEKIHGYGLNSRTRRFGLFGKEEVFCIPMRIASGFDS